MLTDMFYLITRQRVQTWILFNIPSSDIKASTVKGTPHSVTNQGSWIIREHAVTTAQSQFYKVITSCIGVQTTRN